MERRPEPRARSAYAPDHQGDPRPARSMTRSGVSSIQKLDDAFVKDAQAKGIDSSVNVEQMQDWAATCKALGQ